MTSPPQIPKLPTVFGHVVEFTPLNNIPQLVPVPEPAAFAPDPEFDVRADSPPRKMARSQMRTWAMKQGARQGGLCALCAEPLDFHSKGAVVIDHDHKSGLVRGVLCRPCNGAEGKVANAAGRWGARSMEYSKIIPFLKRLIAYLEKPPIPLIYPLHKSPEDKRITRNAAARQARANAKAAKAVKAHQHGK